MCEACTCIWFSVLVQQAIHDLAVDTDRRPTKRGTLMFFPWPQYRALYSFPIFTTRQTSILNTQIEDTFPWTRSPHKGRKIHLNTERVLYDNMTAINMIGCRTPFCWYSWFNYFIWAKQRANALGVIAHCPSPVHVFKHAPRPVSCETACQKSTAPTVHVYVIVIRQGQDDPAIGCAL